ncbi:site-specific integrase [Lactobacillus panisapium]|uniref:site-specific integrase n=1 Tax=Lactobacillus panisapium TaxID=2012495 RepID=UPI00215DBC8D|nr:site-specific integrase [Lactobacillus panisapium]
MTTYNNWKYTVKLVSRFFGKKKVCDIKEKDIRNFAREYVKTYNTVAAPHSTIARQLQNLRAFFHATRLWLN